MGFFLWFTLSTCSHSSTDRTRDCGSRNVGSIPTESTKNDGVRFSERSEDPVKKRGY